MYLQILSHVNLLLNLIINDTISSKLIKLDADEHINLLGGDEFVYKTTTFDFSGPIGLIPLSGSSVLDGTL